MIFYRYMDTKSEYFIKKWKYSGNTMNIEPVSCTTILRKPWATKTYITGNTFWESHLLNQSKHKLDSNLLASTKKKDGYLVIVVNFFTLCNWLQPVVIKWLPRALSVLHTHNCTGHLIRGNPSANSCKMTSNDYNQPIEQEGYWV